VSLLLLCLIIVVVIIYFFVEQSAIGSHFYLDLLSIYDDFGL